MSYILDALRRAEADRERERGQVPGLHTPAGPPATPPSSSGSIRWWPWAGGGLLLLAGMGAGSWWASSSPDTPAPATQPAPPAAPVALPAPTVTPTTVSPPAPAVAASGSPYLPPAPPVQVPQVQAQLAPPPAPARPVAPAPAPEAALPRLSDLPESLRRELPKLSISGTVYADEPASRFVIVNGDVLREGAKLGPELVLEQIRPHELVFSFRGQRYRQPV